ncbi:MAG: serine--tRNA ligase [Candidatus Eutrophobiaceae bacterium]
MLNPKLFRNADTLNDLAAALVKRGMQLDIPAWLDLEVSRKRYQSELESLRADRRRKSQEVAQCKGNGEDASNIIKEVNEINKKLKEVEVFFEDLQAELHERLIHIPNSPHPSVPEGSDEQSNALLRTWGEPTEFAFEPVDHVSLGENLRLLDFEAGARVAGSRFVVMHQGLARLHRALIQFMLDLHITDHGYQEVNVPYLVNKDSAFGTGQLPKFATDLYHIGEQGYYLIPTAEVPVTNLLRDQIVAADQLPLKYVCHSPCFRSEAGSYGKDVRGMIRLHQFEKVELVQCVRPEDSWDVLEDLTVHAERVLQLLELPYRVMILCGGDLGFSAAKTYDIEVWLPGQGQYREISSCSNFEDFQARRMHARWRNPANGGKPESFHTLNGSGLAVGRTLIAIMENCQDKHGCIHIPPILHPYMGGISLLEPV